MTSGGIACAGVPGGGVGVGGAGGGGRLVQAASNPPTRIAAAPSLRGKALSNMWVILLEALAALALLVFIVWWTMFHGRRRGERPTDREGG